MRRDVIELGQRVAACLEEENHGGGRSCGVPDCGHVPCARRRAAVAARARAAVLTTLARLWEEVRPR
ncbi:MAG TPA: hypothetical protein VNO79_00905 [Actinomycetota bacterium]|nr:hypothetical protein [Actinomycetota bacterium]